MGIKSIIFIVLRIMQDMYRVRGLGDHVRILTTTLLKQFLLGLQPQELTG